VLLRFFRLIRSGGGNIEENGEQTFLQRPVFG
jgi:hypothetical protein